MIEKPFLLMVLCSIARSSEVASLAGAPAQVVAASSQYFERNFNRLIVAPALDTVNPVAPVPPVLIDPANVPVQPIEQIQPSVAIAVASAHAAAPVSTILLPPYPFGLPPGFGFIQPINVSDEDRKEATTQATTEKVSEETTQNPLPSNNANAFAEVFPPFPPNLNAQHSAPPVVKPQKFITTVEVVPVPLTYIAPPPLKLEPIKAVKHVHTFVPSKARLIIRPVRIRTIRVPAKIIRIAPISRNSGPRYRQNFIRGPNNGRDIEPTTFRPFNRPNTKPPRF